VEKEWFSIHKRISGRKNGKRFVKLWIEELNKIFKILKSDYYTFLGTVFFHSGHVVPSCSAYKKDVNLEKKSIALL
jgi:hypothetical protein